MRLEVGRITFPPRPPHIEPTVIERNFVRDYVEMRLMLTRIMLRGGSQGRMAKDVLDRTADAEPAAGNGHH